MRIIEGLMLLGVGVLVAYIALNWTLGCESWDRTTWTPEHSCIGWPEIANAE